MAFRELEDSIRNILKRLGVLENNVVEIPETPDASTTVKGIVELATAAETKAGVDTERAVTPAGLGALASVSLFNGSADGGSNVTLSQDLTDFTSLTVYFKDNDDQHASMNIWVADCTINTSSATATNYGLYSEGGATTAYMKRRIIYFYSATSLRNVGTQYVAVSGNTWTSNNSQISITRVVGHY